MEYILEEINIYFCLRHDHKPYPQVIDSLNMQTILCELKEVRVIGGVENTHRNFSTERVKAEQECRRQIHQKAVEDNREFYCVSDWDYLHLINTNIQDLLTKMTVDDSFGAISITNKPHAGLCDIGFAMYRLEAAKKAKLNELVNTTNRCMCIDTNTAILKAGYKFEYLDTLNRVREL